MSGISVASIALLLTLCISVVQRLTFLPVTKLFVIVSLVLHKQALYISLISASNIYKQSDFFILSLNSCCSVSLFFFLWLLVLSGHISFSNKHVIPHSNPLFPGGTCYFKNCAVSFYGFLSCFWHSFTVLTFIGKTQWKHICFADGVVRNCKRMGLLLTLDSGFYTICACPGFGQGLG